MGVDHVDGNALAGMLAELMSADASTLRVTCGHCGSQWVMAQVAVERDDVCAIARCVGCRHTLITLLRGPDGSVRLRIEGVAEIASG